MNRARAVLRICNSLVSTRLSTTRPFFNQVTHFHSLSRYPLSCEFNSPYTRQRVFYFSSKPNSLVQLLLTNDWSTELENELENLNLTLTHETVVYVLKKLDEDPEKAWDFFNWVSNRNGFKLSSPLYCMMLRILVSKDKMNNFWSAVNKMKEEGFYIDEETYVTILGIFKKEKMVSDSTALTHFYERMVKENGKNNLVNDVVSVIVKGDLGDEVEKELEAMKIVLTDDLVFRVLKELRNYPSKVLNFSRWLGRHEGYEYNGIIYNAIARVLGRNDSIVEFWNVVEEMKNAGYEMDLDTYIKISRQFQKTKMIEDAVKLYEFMMNGTFKPSDQDCFLLLRSISGSDNPNVDLVFRISKKYEEMGNVFSKAVYDGMHRAFTKAGKFDEAEKIIRAMKSSGFEPDNITYSQSVFGLCKAGRFEEGEKVLDDMEEAGCTPDVKTWTILIQAHCAANQVDTALMCFGKMIEKGCNPDADLLRVLINGFLSQKRLDGAYTLLVEMVDKFRLVPWQATYKLMIEKLLAVMKLEEALKLLHSMRKHNHPPYTVPFVQYISKYGTVQDAVDFLKALSVKQDPSLPAYVNVFKSFFDEGRHSEAKDLLYKCPHHIRKHPKICELFGSAKNPDTAA